MIRFNKLTVTAMAAVMAAALTIGGCSQTGSSTESSAESADTAGDSDAADGESTDTSAESEADMAQVTEDADKIAALDPVKPENLGNIEKLEYKGLEFDAPIAETVTDADVDEYLSTYVLPYSLIEVNNGTVEDGDTVNINYVGTINGEAFDGGSADDQDLVIGSGSFIDGFEEGLIGAHQFETLDLALKFPDDYWDSELAGQDVNFTVDINSISRAISIDQFDDEAARSISQDDTMTAESYRAELKDNLQRNAELSAKSEMYNNGIAAALAVSELEPSEAAIEWQIDSALKSYDSNLQAQGLTLAYYMYMLGTNYDDFRAQISEMAPEATKEVMLRYAVCEAEGLEYNDETRQQYLDEFGYTQEELDSVATEDEQETAVIWYLAGKTIADNGNVNYVEATAEETVTGEAVTDEAAAEDAE